MKHKVFWRFMLAHMLFYIGHFVSKIMNVWPCAFLHPYPLYNWLMIKSAENNPQSRLWNGDPDAT